jgi:hypothetical protein
MRAAHFCLAKDTAGLLSLVAAFAAAAGSIAGGVASQTCTFIVAVFAMRGFAFESASMFSVATLLYKIVRAASMRRLPPRMRRQPLRSEQEVETSLRVM